MKYIFFIVFFPTLVFSNTLEKIEKYLQVNKNLLIELKKEEKISDEKILLYINEYNNIIEKTEKTESFSYFEKKQIDKISDIKLFERNINFIINKYGFLVNSINIKYFDNKNHSYYYFISKDFAVFYIKNIKNPYHLKKILKYEILENDILLVDKKNKNRKIIFIKGIKDVFFQYEK